jgi:hypothetical protein
MAVPENLHDDTVMSLALSCWDIPQHPLRPQTNTLHEDEGTAWQNPYDV